MIEIYSSNYTVTNTDLWNIVANNRRIYGQFINTNLKSLQVLNLMFKYSDIIKQYNLTCNDYKFVRDNRTSNWYSVGQTTSFDGYNPIQQDRTMCMCVIKGFINTDKQIHINMNGGSGCWEFIMRLQQGFGLSDKSYQCNLINPTYTSLLNEFNKGIKSLTSK